MEDPAHTLTLRQAPWPLHPLWAYFDFGTTTGALRFVPGSCQVLAVENTCLGNGHFAQLLQHLKRQAAAEQRDVVILAIHNTRLYHHLHTQHGYRPIPNSKHLLLPVAGTGLCPPDLQEEIDAPPTKESQFMDQMLDLLTDILKPAHGR